MALISCTACTPAVSPPPSTGLDPSVATITQPADPSRSAPEGAPDNSCWDRTTTPAEVRTTTRAVEITPAETSGTGTIRTPAVFRNEEVTEITRPREDIWFEVLCPARMTPDVTATLQRALIARGYLQGPADGIYDERTRAAVATLQTRKGYPGKGLSLAAARALGLIVTPAPDTGPT